MGRKFRIYVEEVGNDGSEFQLIFKLDDKIKDIKTEYSIEDCLDGSSKFLGKNTMKYNFDGRFDKLEINLDFQIGM